MDKELRDAERAGDAARARALRRRAGLSGHEPALRRRIVELVERWAGCGRREEALRAAQRFGEAEREAGAAGRALKALAGLGATAVDEVEALAGDGSLDATRALCALEPLRALPVLRALAREDPQARGLVVAELGRQGFARLAGTPEALLELTRDADGQVRARAWATLRARFAPRALSEAAEAEARAPGDVGALQVLVSGHHAAALPALTAALDDAPGGRLPLAIHALQLLGRSQEGTGPAVDVPGSEAYLAGVRPGLALAVRLALADPTGAQALAAGPLDRWLDAPEAARDLLAARVAVVHPGPRAQATALQLVATRATPALTPVLVEALGRTGWTRPSPALVHGFAGCGARGVEALRRVVHEEDRPETRALAGALLIGLDVASRDEVEALLGVRGRRVPAELAVLVRKLPGSATLLRARRLLKERLRA